MSKVTKVNWMTSAVKSSLTNRGIGILCAMAAAAFSLEGLRADVFPTGCDKASGGQGNTSTTGINFNYHQAHLNDVVQVFPTLGMVGPALPQTGGGCEALNATGSVYIASGLLVTFLNNVTLDPGFIYQCPTNASPPCTAGPYNVTITAAIVGVGVSYPEGSIGGAVNTVRALQWSFSNKVRSNPSGFETLDKIDTASITVVHPCIAVVKQCQLPTGRSCFNPGEAVVFTGYVTNCGDINLTNVLANDTQTGRLILNDPVTGLPLPTNSNGGITLTVGSIAAYRASYVPTLAETCAGTTLNSVTATGTDTSDIGGPNASVTNSTSASCPICIVPGLVVTKACPAQPTPPGGTLIFSGTVTNTGNSTLTNVTVVNNQPVPNTLVFGPVTLASGAGAAFTGSYTVPLDSCGPYSDTLTARGTTQCGQNTTNTATAICPGTNTPCISVTKFCTTNVVGTTQTISGVVSNCGNISLTNIVISDSVVGAVTNITTLAPGGSVAYSKSFTAVCNGNNGLVTVIGTSVCGRSVTNTATATCVTICQPSIKVYKQVVCWTNPCEAFNPDLTTQKFALGMRVDPSNCASFCYRITVTNSGAVALTNVTVVDNQLSLAGCFPGPFTLAVGATTNCIVPNVAHCSNTTNIVTATGFGPPGTTPAPVTSTDTNAVVIVPISVSCTLLVSIDGGPFNSYGSNCPSVLLGHSYVIRTVVTNNGSYTLDNVTLASTTLCFGITNIGTMAVGASRTLDCSYTCSAPAQNTYCVNVSGVPSQSAGHVCAYNSAGQIITTTSQCCTCVLCTGVPKICVTKEVACWLGGTNCGPFGKIAYGMASPTEEASFCYSITVSNCGSVALTNVSLIDDKYGNLTGDFSCVSPVFAVGASCTFTYKSAIGAGTNETIETLTNTVIASGCSVINGQCTNSSDFATVIVVPASIACQKFYTVDGGPPTNNATLIQDSTPHTVVWYLTIRNTGIANLHDITILDVSSDPNCGVGYSLNELPEGGSVTFALCTNASFICSTGAVDTVTVTAHQFTFGTNEIALCSISSGPNGTNVPITVSSQCSAKLTCAAPPTTGCTPGFWKNCTIHWQLTGYTTDQPVSSVFNLGNCCPSLGSASLLNALSFQGGSGSCGAGQILLRTAVGGLLNASSPELNYSYAFTKQEIISMVNAAFQSCNRDTMTALASEFDRANNMGCMNLKGEGLPCHQLLVPRIAPTRP